MASDIRPWQWKALYTVLILFSVGNAWTAYDLIAFKSQPWGVHTNITQAVDPVVQKVTRWHAHPDNEQYTNTNPTLYTNKYFTINDDHDQIVTAIYTSEYTITGTGANRKMQSVSGSATRISGVYYFTNDPNVEFTSTNPSTKITNEIVYDYNYAFIGYTGDVFEYSTGSDVWHGVEVTSNQYWDRSVTRSYDHVMVSAQDVLTNYCPMGQTVIVSGAIGSTVTVECVGDLVQIVEERYTSGIESNYSILDEHVALWQLEQACLERQEVLYDAPSSRSRKLYLFGYLTLVPLSTGEGSYTDLDDRDYYEKLVTIKHWIASYLLGYLDKSKADENGSYENYLSTTSNYEWVSNQWDEVASDDLPYYGTSFEHTIPYSEPTNRAAIYRRTASIPDTRKLYDLCDLPYVTVTTRYKATGVPGWVVGDMTNRYVWEHNTEVTRAIGWLEMTYSWPASRVLSNHYQFPMSFAGMVTNASGEATQTVRIVEWRPGLGPGGDTNEWNQTLWTNLEPYYVSPIEDFISLPSLVEFTTNVVGTTGEVFTYTTTNFYIPEGWDAGDLLALSNAIPLLDCLTWTSANGAGNDFNPRWQWEFYDPAYYARRSNETAGTYSEERESCMQDSWTNYTASVVSNAVDNYSGGWPMAQTEWEIAEPSNWTVKVWKNEQDYEGSSSGGGMFPCCPESTNVYIYSSSISWQMADSTGGTVCGSSASTNSTLLNSWPHCDMSGWGESTYSWEYIIQFSPSCVDPGATGCEQDYSSSGESGAHGQYGFVSCVLYKNPDDSVSSQWRYGYHKLLLPTTNMQPEVDYYYVGEHQPHSTNLTAVSWNPEGDIGIEISTNGYALSGSTNYEIRIQNDDAWLINADFAAPSGSNTKYPFHEYESDDGTHTVQYWNLSGLKAVLKWEFEYSSDNSP
jgi:hypothetical protein